MIDNVENYSDIRNNKAFIGWYWHDSFDKNYSNLDKKLADKKEEEEKCINLKNLLLVIEPAVMRWNKKSEDRYHKT